jgi:hypothetical protein
MILERRCWICDLPDEILVMTFEQIRELDDEFTEEYLSLLLVCKSWLEDEECLHL